MPGHSDKPSCSKNQAPSAIDSTVTEKMTKASAKRPCEEREPGMPSCCAIAAGVHCCDSSWQSIPAGGCMRNRFGRTITSFPTEPRASEKGPGVGCRSPLEARLGAQLGYGLEHRGDGVADFGNFRLAGNQRRCHDQGVERHAHVNIELVIHVLGCCG